MYFGLCSCQHNGTYTRNVYPAIPTKKPAQILRFAESKSEPLSRKILGKTAQKALGKGTGPSNLPKSILTLTGTAAATLSAKPPPAPGFAALLDWCSTFRAFVDRRVCVIPLCVVVPYTAFTAAEFLPRNVAGWNEALPTVQTGQFIRHEAILLACFFHLTTQGKVQDYLTLTFIYGVT